MKKWIFKVNSNVQDVSKKLRDSFGSAKGFVFNLDKDDDDSFLFKIHKQGLYAFHLMFINKIIANGTILKTDTNNESIIEISFKQYFLWKLIIFTHIILGFGFLAMLFLKINGNAFIAVFGFLLLAVGIILWITAQRKFKKDVQEYKSLISGILES